MSLVDAVHTLLEVAAGRLNLSPQAADELHASIDAEQDPVIADNPPAPAEPTPPTVEPPPVQYPSAGYYPPAGA